MNYLLLKVLPFYINACKSYDNKLTQKILTNYIDKIHDNVIDLNDFNKYEIDLDISNFLNQPFKEIEGKPLEILDKLNIPYKHVGFMGLISIITPNNNIFKHGKNTRRVLYSSRVLCTNLIETVSSDGIGLYFIDDKYLFYRENNRYYVPV